jgi:hypothetical protein
MSDKQVLLKAVADLPDGAGWSEITDTLLTLLARRGSVADFARLYRAQFTAEQLAEYLNPRMEHALADVIAELEAQPAEKK